MFFQYQIIKQSSFLKKKFTDLEAQHKWNEKEKSNEDETIKDYLLLLIKPIAQTSKAEVQNTDSIENEERDKFQNNWSLDHPEVLNENKKEDAIARPEKKANNPSRNLYSP